MVRRRAEHRRRLIDASHYEEIGVKIGACDVYAMTPVNCVEFRTVTLRTSQIEDVVQKRTATPRTEKRKPFWLITCDTFLLPHLRVMRIRIPTILPSTSTPPFPSSPSTSSSPPPTLTPSQIAHATHHLTSFLSKGNTCVLTGAGVSVDSGIRAYRGRDGRYMNPDYKPILYHELVDPSSKGYEFRQRYWLRSYLGYPPLLAALPNTTHTALAALQYTRHVSKLITQNVDGLHQKALSLSPTLRLKTLETEILELHGSLHKVHCTHSHQTPRQAYQHLLSSSNPLWAKFSADVEGGRREGVRTNPDGDVAIESLGVSYASFVVPPCPVCAREGRRDDIMKPDVIFFGESIPSEVKELSFKYIESSDRLLVIGTTLATYSAFRLLKYALSLSKPVLILNVGPTRADALISPPPISPPTPLPPSPRLSHPPTSGLLTQSVSSSSLDTLDIPPNPLPNANPGTPMISTDDAWMKSGGLFQKIEVPSGLVLRDVVRRLMGAKANTDPILAHLLHSGVVKPPDEGDDDRVPRAAG
ncbi:DHS-like NAD/FAD-binding domain-containing protein [Rickenella mellea]|uniref:DHS-like NAD/FAD-binding domain-containing protein n=1 Tax=Rickenella mellea TaxID=50990 RepID=A0A4Y7PTG9_9AGAM|nr:DHS-like NAD/FAD-binding domain-containing protein [Rickenella mellea]